MTGPVVGVDGTALSRLPDGVGRYASNVLRATALARPDWQFVVVGFRDDLGRPSMVPDLPNVRRHLVPLPRRPYEALYSLVARVPLDPWVPHLDVLIAPNFVAFPALRRVPTIVTIHDLTYVDHPEAVEARNLRHLRRHVPAAVAGAAAVTVISEFTRERVKAVFPAAADVRIVGCGLDPVFLGPSAADGRAVAADDDLPLGHVLAVGTLEPRKNLATLLRAYALLPPELRERHPLVVVGRAGWGGDTVPDDVPAEVVNAVQFTGFVPDEVLPRLYARARLFVFPSTYEGFGLPMLEAMAAGVPVVASDIPTFRAIGGDLVDRVAPLDPRAFADAMQHRLLVRDEARIDEARRRAREWTWERSGHQLAEVIEGVVR